MIQYDGGCDECDNCLQPNRDATFGEPRQQYEGKSADTGYDIYEYDERGVIKQQDRSTGENTKDQLSGAGFKRIQRAVTRFSERDPGPERDASPPVARSTLKLQDLERKKPECARKQQVLRESIEVSRKSPRSAENPSLDGEGSPPIPRSTLKMQEVMNEQAEREHKLHIKDLAKRNRIAKKEN